MLTTSQPNRSFTTNSAIAGYPAQNNQLALPKQSTQSPRHHQHAPKRTNIPTHQQQHSHIHTFTHCCNTSLGYFQKMNSTNCSSKLSQTCQLQLSLFGYVGGTSTLYVKGLTHSSTLKHRFCYVGGISTLYVNSFKSQLNFKTSAT